MEALPESPTLRVSEVAHYYGVDKRTVYLWVEHNHLKTVMTPGGQKRITRESFDTCRFNDKMAARKLPKGMMSGKEVL